MTVSSTLAKISYAGNDSNTSFSFSFTVFANTDLVVTFTNSSGVESTLVEGTGTSNYSVSVSSYPGTGSITWPASGSTKLQSNEKITIKRVLPLTQTIDLQNQGGYFPDVQETGFDKGVYLSQQIDEEVDRSIKIPVSSATSIDSTLPAPTADTVIGAWNSDADAIVAGPTVANITAAESNATAAAASAVTAASEASAANPKYTFSTSTSMADPGVGTLRYNHGTVASVTAIAIDETTADTGNPDIEAWIASWDDSTSTVKGWLRLVEPGTPANYAVFHITGLTDNSGWIQLAVTHVDSNGTFGNGDSIRVMFSRTGDKGATGDTGTAATIAAGSTTTGSAGSSASVTNAGSSSAATFNFTIPRGDTGATGAAATIAVGSTTTGSPGTSASVTNAGSSSAATFNFTIPRGDVGAQGPQGDTGAAGSLSGAPDGSAGAPSISFASDTDTGIFRSGGNTLDITTGGVLRATFSSSGVNLVGTPTFGGSALAVGSGGTGSANAADARTALGVAIGSDVQAHDADTLKADTADVLTAGFAASVHDLGTISSGTTTLDEANGNLQKCINGGAFTLAPPSNSCTIVLQVTNNSSAGAISSSGFTLTDGDSISTGNGDNFFLYVTVVGSFSHLTVKKLS